MYEALRSGDYDTWRNTGALAVEDSGQQEILNWMCLAGALQGAGPQAGGDRLHRHLDLQFVQGLPDRAA